MSTAPRVLNAHLVTCNRTPVTPVTLHYHKLTELILPDWH